MKTQSIFLVILLSFMLHVLPSVAQDTYNLAPNPEFTVSGTSTIHDWTMEGKEGTGIASFLIENGSLKKIGSLNVQLPVKSLKSGKTQMDKNAYAALNEDKHPNILFELTKVREINDQHIIADGKLTISGTTRPITLKTDYNISGNTIEFNGVQEITFTEFGLTPPTAVLGTIKTGDKLQLAFRTSFKHQSVMP